MFIDINKVSVLFKYDQYDPLLFASSFFLFLFLGLLLILSVIRDRKIQTFILIAFSVFFYYKASGDLLGLLIAAGIANYFIGKGIYRTEGQGGKRALLLLGVLVNLGVLIYFKYTNFLIEIYNSAMNGSIEAWDIIQPLGISFYIFKALSYLFDIYLEMHEPEESFFDFFLYLSFFPAVLSGPIDRAGDFLTQIKNPLPFTNATIAKAVFLISMGLLKKNLIADYISINFVERVFDEPARFTGVENLLAVYGYTLQIYCDFSGYTDMAIGIGMLMGFKMMDNFNYPYKAVSVTDFWRRWHLSLSAWLQNYLFKPIQIGLRSFKIWGNAVAILITFTLCGLWHGASYNFIIWGLLHAFFMVFSLFTKNIRDSIASFLRIKDTLFHKFLKVFITFHLIAFAWIFFRASSFEKAETVLKQIATFFQPEVFPQFVDAFFPVFILMCIGYIIHFLPSRLENVLQTFLEKITLPGQAVVLAIAIWISAQARFADLQPFIYFQF
ncbi:MAG: MBOAT family protein [Ignavibacteriaceae bacterium]|nr:MBOAT family protein [Ignavibacteriaceae bacterium]